MNKLKYTGISPMNSDFYRHSYMVFETCSNNREVQVAQLPEGTVLPYKYQYNNGCLLSLHLYLKQELLPAIGEIKFCVLRVYHCLLNGNASYRIMRLQESADQMQALFYRYITSHMIIRIAEVTRGQSSTSHSITEYLNHFRLFTDDAADRVADLATQLEKSCENSQHIKGNSYATELLRHCLKNLQLVLEQTLQRTIYTELALQDPTNKIILS